MKRVMIVGCAGSGKSTLAVEFGAITGLPVVHIDQLYWNAHWQRREADEYRARLTDAVAEDEWIIDGSYSSTFPERLARADTLIFLDFPIWLCLWRVVMRTLKHYGRTRPDLPEGCHERFDWDFLKWIAGYRKRTRPTVLNLIRDAPECVRCNHLRTVGEVRRFLESASRRG